MSHVVSPMRDEKGIVRTLDYRSSIRTWTDPGQVARIGAGVRTMRGLLVFSAISDGTQS